MPNLYVIENEFSKQKAYGTVLNKEIRKGWTYQRITVPTVFNQHRFEGDVANIVDVESPDDLVNTLCSEPCLIILDVDLPGIQDKNTFNNISDPLNQFWRTLHSKGSVICISTTEAKGSEVVTNFHPEFPDHFTRIAPFSVTLGNEDEDNVATARRIIQSAFSQWDRVYGQKFLSSLTAKEWLELREQGRRLCTSIGKERGLQHGKWLHHCSDGGLSATDGEYDDACKKLQDQLSGTHGVGLSQYEATIWKFPDQWGGNAPGPWDEVPIRALIQFTDDGWDVQSATYLLKYISDRLVHGKENMGITVQVQDALTSFLWPINNLYFNFPALCQGLWELSNGALENAANGDNIWISWCATAHAPVNTGRELNLIITYRQVLITRESGHAKITGLHIPSPDKCVMRAYDYLSNVGTLSGGGNSGQIACEIRLKKRWIDEEQFDVWEQDV